MVPDYKILNHGRTVETGGLWYDFRDPDMAEVFVRTIKTGTPPSLAYKLLTDSRIFPAKDH